MDTLMVIGLAIAIPVTLFPAALVWYMNIGGAVAAIKAARARRAAETRAA